MLLHLYVFLKLANYLTFPPVTIGHFGQTVRFSFLFLELFLYALLEKEKHFRSNFFLSWPMDVSLSEVVLKFNLRFYQSEASGTWCFKNGHGSNFIWKKRRESTSVRVWSFSFCDKTNSKLREQEEAFLYLNMTCVRRESRWKWNIRNSHTANRKYPDVVKLLWKLTCDVIIQQTKIVLWRIHVLYFC